MEAEALGGVVAFHRHSANSNPQEWKKGAGEETCQPLSSQSLPCCWVVIG